MKSTIYEPSRHENLSCVPTSRLGPNILVYTLFSHTLVLKFGVFWHIAPCNHVEVDDVSEVRTASILRALSHL
jgi:hypothetical protein